MLKTVKVPLAMEPFFKKAQDYVASYFRDRVVDPTKGTIEIFGERYILVRSASMSVDFFDIVKGIYCKDGENEGSELARQMLFDVAHAIGKQDARCFTAKMKIEDRADVFAAGPVHFSYTGWAFVDILPESAPTKDENFMLVYDHPYSFESDAWLKAGRSSLEPVCIMNAGYSSGWCEESFGVSLSATEIICRAKGDDCCRFIMAPLSHIDARVAEYKKKRPDLAKKITTREVPGFFKRKVLDDELKYNEKLFRTIASMSPVGFLKTDAQGRFVYVNSRWRQISGILEGEVSDERLALSIHPDDRRSVVDEWVEAMKNSRPFKKEFRFLHEDGSVVWVIREAVPVFNDDGVATGYVGTLADITVFKKSEEELMRLNAKLVESVENIKTLSGLLPICASCKKIRNDNGYWQKLESYISEHTMADFTHGICPDCSRKLLK